MPRIPTSVRTAGFIMLALIAYFIFRGVTRSTDLETSAQIEESSAQTTQTIPVVIVKPAQFEEREVIASLKGRSEPDREVVVRAQTAGTVVEAEIEEGQPVRKGTLLCGLDIESRAARIAEAEASIEVAKIDHEAALQLAEKELASPNRVAAAKAALDRSVATLSAAKIELAKTRVTAPFSGIFEERSAELGDFLATGGACGRVVDLDPIVVAVEATETQVQSLQLNDRANVSFATGTQAEGKLRFIASTASPQTRTFRVEVEIPNPDRTIAAGLTATVDIALGSASAVLLSPASLVLHDDGRVGVRYVDANDIIRFAEVSVADDANDGVWVTGLPSNARLLAPGQDFLREGVKVSTRLSQDL